MYNTFIVQLNIVRENCLWLHSFAGMIMTQFLRQSIHKRHRLCNMGQQQSRAPPLYITV